MWDCETCSTGLRQRWPRSCWAGHWVMMIMMIETIAKSWFRNLQGPRPRPSTHGASATLRLIPLVFAQVCSLRRARRACKRDRRETMQCYIVEGKSKRLRLWYDFTVIQQSSKTIIQTQRNNISQDRIYIYIYRTRNATKKEGSTHHWVRGHMGTWELQGKCNT